MLQTKLALKMKKPIISCKNEKGGNFGDNYFVYV